LLAEQRAHGFFVVVAPFFNEARERVALLSRYLEDLEQFGRQRGVAVEALTGGAPQQHVDHRHPILARAGKISGEVIVAHHMRVPILPHDPGRGIIALRVALAHVALAEDLDSLGLEELSGAQQDVRARCRCSA
jgi:hypothetical protein